MTSQPPTKPKDLGLKMGSPLMVFWTNVRDSAKITIEDAKNTLLLQTAVLDMAEEKVKEEEEKGKHLNRQ